MSKAAIEDASAIDRVCVRQLQTLSATQERLVWADGRPSADGARDADTMELSVKVCGRH
ncbi:hypothetical protein MES5069_310045 [Mesorhizobium escarrei]|uniref:Uncharacterized protein n=1 Tax=Mesorhizobium escarrei TaxID=666018 RepID=A0ABM9DZT6_9HYPH|nr:hypothetical protein MES5069_310045 [Mesorhizobium escarrei]